MTRFADPHTCPDCGAAIDPASAACTTCALPLRGPVAQQLYATLLTADELLEKLRSTARVAVPASTAVGAGQAPPMAHPAVGAVPAPAPYPADSPQQQPPRHGLAAPTVPKILLGLGALCLLVAALVFLAVAWAVLGVGGRTVVLVGMTAGAGGASYLLAHKDLRSGAESLAVVAFGLLALDVAGAENAGWLGDPGPGVLLVVMGMALAVFAHTAAEVARTTPVARLATAEITTASGAVLVVTGALTRLDHPEAVLSVAVLALVCAAALTHRRGFTIVTPLLGASAGVWWLALTILGLNRAIEHHSLGELWGRLDAWPTLVAALFAVAVALAPRVAQPLRITGAATAGTLLVVLVSMPANFESLQTAFLTWLALLVATAAVTYAVPGPWRAAPAVPMAASAFLPLAVVGELIGAALVAAAPGEAWDRGALTSLQTVDAPVSAYLLVPGMLGLLLAAIATARFVTDPLPLLREYAVPLATGLALGALGTVALLGPPLLVVVLALIVVAAVLTWWALAADREPWLTLPAALLILALVIGLASAWTTAVALVVITAAAAVLAVTGSRVTRPVGLATLPPALAGLVWTAAEIGHLDPAQRGIPVLLLLGALAIARPQPVAEVAAALAATVAAAAAIGAATDSQGSLALHLTIAGALVTVTSLVNEERRFLGWAGGLLLAMATWVRLEQLGVTAPEPYTLPSAVALLVGGGLHLRRHPDATTYPTLLPGLGLALVPSLLWALDDPISWRALAVGGVSAGLVIAGAAVRWSAPVVAGAVVGVVLVLREASPFLGSIHPWIVIGLVGTLLTALGVTWESRVREVRAAGDYLRRLR